MFLEAKIRTSKSRGSISEVEGKRENTSLTELVAKRNALENGGSKPQVSAVFPLVSIDIYENRIHPQDPRSVCVSQMTKCSPQVLSYFSIIAVDYHRLLMRLRPPHI
jgi:hypothetical protein